MIAAGAHPVADYTRGCYEALADTHVYGEPVKQTAAVALREVVRAVNAINLDESPIEIERKVAAACEKLTEVKRRVRVTCARPAEIRGS